jgi:general secretion pathway protein G
MSHLVRPCDPARPAVRAGFTLVELMAVIAIIGLLAAIILGISGYVARRGDMAKAQGDMEKIKMALEEYKVNFGRFWPNDGPVTNSTYGGVTFSNALSGYVADIRLLDPWNRGYMYDFMDNAQYRLWSYGPDGADGTSDDIESTKSAF